MAEFTNVNIQTIAAGQNVHLTETAIRMPLRPTRTQHLPARLLWRQLPATLPVMQTTSPSLMTAMTCRSDTKRSIR